MTLSVTHERWNYPGGEIGLRSTDVRSQLTARIQSSDDLMALFLYLEAVGSQGVMPDHVFIPYMPYARQDRVAERGDPNAMKMLGRLLAALGLYEVETMDLHSVAGALAMRESGVIVRNRTPSYCISQYLQRARLGTAFLWLVAPDVGASAKVAAYARDILPAGVIYCTKHRDPTTGKLSHFSVEPGAPEQLSEGHSLVVVDDICDGGGTFQGVAQALDAHFRTQHAKHLFTTHGIYSKGLDPLIYGAGFRTVGSTDSFRHGQEHSQLITIPIP